MPKLCVALDLPSKAENLALCAQIAPNAAQIIAKIGLRTFIRDGNAFIKEVQNLGFGVFLDLKLYDIPNTMLDTLDEIIALNIDMLTIHASSGRVAMSAIAKRVARESKPPLVFAVTALTSFNESDFAEIYRTTPQNAVINLAQIACECGISGIVCAPMESKMIKETHPNLLTLTPGIRPNASDFSVRVDLYTQDDDQNRTASLKNALAQKSDFIVIGRPIYRHSEPALITREILSVLEMNNGNI